MKRDDLWSFAVACYAKPGVEAACLQLQAAGMDVCLLLAGAWLECRRIACDDTRIQRLKDISNDWQILVVAPLRGLRQGWRQQADRDIELAGLRARIKQLELEAEQVQLRRLQSATASWPTSHGTTDWLDQLCTVHGDETRAAVETVRRAAVAQLAFGGD